MQILRFDHIVLTVEDMDATCCVHERVSGMQPVTFAGGRTALALGQQKINLHPRGRESDARARASMPGSADV